MTIKVKLSGSTVTVHPMSQGVGKGVNQLDWGPHENSDTFTFDTPAISFDDSGAPISGISFSGNTASATDNNANSGSTDQDYTYRVHLIDASGNKITYPSTDTMTTDPTIKNKPL